VTDVAVGVDAEGPFRSIAALIWEVSVAEDATMGLGACAGALVVAICRAGGVAAAAEVGV